MIDNTAPALVPLSFEQCREALIRLQQYAQWMYHTPAGVAAFARNSAEHAGRRFSFSVQKDGLIAMTLADTGAKALFNVVVTTSPLQTEHTLDNVEYRVGLVNAADLSAEDAEFAREGRVFALSLFQRTQAFQFFCRMQPPTIDGIARDLAQAT